MVGYLHWSKGKRLHALQTAENLRQEAVIETARAEASAAHLKALDGERDIAAARLETAQAMKAAAEAKTEAEKERVKRLQLEEKLAPRSLTAQQVARVVTLLRPFAGQKVIFFSVSTPESYSLSNQIINAMASAKWLVSTIAGQDNARTVSGILVEVKPSAADVEKDAAKAMADALRAERLVVAGPIEWQVAAMTGAFTPVDPQFPDAAVRITIGTKPQQ